MKTCQEACRVHICVYAEFVCVCLSARRQWMNATSIDLEYWCKEWVRRRHAECVCLCQWPAANFKHVYIYIYIYIQPILSIYIYIYIYIYSASFKHTCIHFLCVFSQEARRVRMCVSVTRSQFYKRRLTTSREYWCKGGILKKKTNPHWWIWVPLYGVNVDFPAHVGMCVCGGTYTFFIHVYIYRDQSSLMDLSTTVWGKCWLLFTRRYVCMCGHIHFLHTCIHI